MSCVDLNIRLAVDRELSRTFLLNLIHVSVSITLFSLLWCLVVGFLCLRVVIGDVCKELLMLILRLRLVALDSKDFVLVWVSLQAPHISAVAQESTAAIRVVSRLHDIND